MKKMESNVRSGRDHMREPRPGKRGGNVRMRVERMAESVDGMLAESGHDTKEAVGKSEGKAELRQKLHIVTNGTKVAFAEYHTTAEEACDIICKELGI